MLKDLFILLDEQGRRQYAALAAISVASSLLQTLGVAAISLFFTVLLGGKLPAAVENYIDVNNIGTLGLIVFFATLSGTVSSALATYFGIRISWAQYPKVASRVLQQYLNNDYQWHLGQSPSALAKTVITEVQGLVNNLLQQYVMLLVRGAEIVFISALLLSVRPMVALVALTSFGFIYSALLLAKKKYIRTQGVRIVQANTERHRATNEALIGIKSVKVAGTETFFLKRFRAAANKLSSATSNVQYFSLMPKYFIETILFGGLVGFVVLSHFRGWDTNESVPLLALYGAAAIRLLPAVQQFYMSLTTIIAAGAAISSVTESLLPQKTATPEIFSQSEKAVLQLHKISYAYPDTVDTVLNKIDLKISSGEKIGIVGATGAGKTTLVDIILGLLPPLSGTVARAPHNGSFAAYVPQTLHFIDESIAANIALGIEAEHWDYKRIEEAAREARIHDHIASLPNGYETIIGEHGVRLSGGQRQRIGIARALYNEPALLILDEASNALDAETERAVVNSLLEQNLTLIVIAHRISILRDCTRILVIEQGQIAAEGTYMELVEKNAYFRRLADADLGKVSVSKSTVQVS